MDVKTYTVEHAPTSGEIRVEINFDYKFQYGELQMSMNDMMKEMVDFWSGSEYRLTDNNGNYFETFLKQLCHEVMILGVDDKNVTGIINEFNNREGWWKIDGSEGIKLLSVENMCLQTQSDYEVKLIF